MKMPFSMVCQRRFSSSALSPFTMMCLYHLPVDQSLDAEICVLLEHFLNLLPLTQLNFFKEIENEPQK